MWKAKDGGIGGGVSATQQAEERLRRSEERWTTEFRREREIYDALAKEHNDLKMIGGPLIAGAAVVALALGAAVTWRVQGQKMLRLTERCNATVAAAQARTLELERRAAKSATRKLARAVVNSACDDLDRIVRLHDPTVKVESVLEGVTMTQTGLHKVLADFGVRRLETVEGALFDPTLHDAVATVPVQGGEVDGGTLVVAELMREGYMLGDATLRPSQVIVTRITEDSISPTTPPPPPPAPTPSKGSC